MINSLYSSTKYDNFLQNRPLNLFPSGPPFRHAQIFSTLVTCIHETVLTYILSIGYSYNMLTCIINTFDLPGICTSFSLYTHICNIVK